MMARVASAEPRRLPFLDAGFLGLETRETPMHVAALQVYSLPKNAAPGFVRALVQQFRSPARLGSPWNLKLAAVPLARLAPAVVETSELDYEYHVRHSALPQPGGERELGELISHLHGVVLDRSRPLWTCHVIEGLQGDRFAIYLKIHHALTDGLRCLQMITASHSTAPGQIARAPWDAGEADELEIADDKGEKPAAVSLREWARALRGAFGSNSGDDAARVRPFQAPRSKLNGKVTTARRVATQQLDLARVKRLAKRGGVSLNDVFLGICSAALRRHLHAQGELPERSMTAAVPVSLRQQGDKTTANAVAFSWVTLASDIADPRERLQAIHASTEAAKNYLRTIPAGARTVIGTLAALPASLVGSLGLSQRLPPAMNLVISNVPGPPEHLYLGDARLEALYPTSIPVQGQVLNITCVSYAGQLNVGFTGSRDALPSLQRLAVYALEAFDELEAAIT
ncbi:MAG: WS/DGAT/MGAT family O-acyltransferase [Panacagrimonas sp.]